jgi:anti-sigma-K factor RskA
MAPMEPQHDEFRDLAPLYVAGALTPEERDDFERHAASCPACRAEIESLGPAAALLAHAVPQHAPPLDLRRRVLEEATGRPHARPPRPVGRAGRLPGLAPWLLAAAALVLAIGLGAYALQLRGRIDALGAKLRAAVENAASLERQLTDVERTAARAQLVAAVISAPDLVRVDLAGQKQMPGAAARAFWSDSRDTLVFNASNLSAPAAGRTYQLWVIPAGASPISAGVFNPDAQGRFETVVPTRPDMPPPAIVAVTEEQDGGSPTGGPTTAPFLAGQASRSAL